jgi:hypothetical protein
VFIGLGKVLGIAGTLRNVGVSRFLLNRVYFENRSFSSSGLSWSLTQSRSATA